MVHKIFVFISVMLNFPDAEYVTKYLTCEILSCKIRVMKTVNNEGVLMAELARIV